MLIRSASCAFFVAAAALVSFDALAERADAGPPADAGAPKRDLEPGRYLYEGGRGRLVVTQKPNGNMTFDLQTSGDNGHACFLDGVIRGGRARIPAASPMCEMTFEVVGDDVAVRGTQSCYETFCGVRGRYEGTYVKPAPGCMPDEIAKTRRESSTLHKAKKHGPAADLLLPVLARCSRVLTTTDAAWIRNDAAVALAKAGRKVECRDVLAPLSDLATATDQSIREGNFPWEVEVLLPLARATRFNTKLCAEEPAAR